MAKTLYALSVKQPWAALIVHGVKTVEVRNWPTQRRGTILIHASSVIDDRPLGWERVPEAAEETVQLLGGIIGCVDLVGCLTYPSRGVFAADAPRHLNDPDWFQEPQMYGFQFERPRVLPFRKVPGWFKFFKVKGEER